MNLSQKAKKAVAAGLAVSTMLMAFSFLAVTPVLAAPHGEGCVVNSGGTVYLVTGGQRRGFTSAEVFTSHGYNFGQVVNTNSETDALPVGPIMVYADGSLVKGPSDPLVYLVANGQKRGFTSGSVFTGLGYSFANIQWAPENTFADLPTGSHVDSATERHPAGTWVLDGSGTVWKMTTTGRVGLPSMAVFNSYGKSWAHVVSANAADLAAPNEGVVAARAACSSPVVPPPAGPLSVSLAGSNPASTTLVATQALADLAHFNVTGSGTISSVVLQRIGVSADTTLEDVFLFDGSTRLTDSATVSSGSLVTFNGLNISVNGSKIISVKADIAASTSGETVGIKAVSLNGNAVSVSGNLHTIASSTLAGASIATATGSVTDPGDDQTVWGGTVTVSTRDVTLTRLALRQVGSIPAGEINNFKLLVDGTEVASASSLDSNNYVTFSTNKTLTTGSRVLKVQANIVGGSNRTVEMDLRGSYDLNVTDTQFGQGVEPTGTFPFGPAASTISAGSMTVVKASASPSGNITNSANDVVYGTYTFTAYGEAIKVETLTVGFDSSGTDADETVRNVRVLVNGSQVGSTTSVAAANTHGSGQSFTTNFIVSPGAPATVEIRGDVFDSEGTNDFAANDTLQVGLLAGSSNAVRQSSLGSISVPSALTVANTLTIKEGGLSMAQTTNYASRTITDPQTAYKIASFVLSGNSTEAVNVNTFDLDIAVTDASGAEFTIADITDVYIMYGSSQTAIKATVTATGNTWSPSFTMDVSGSMTIDVYASIGSDAATSDTVVASLEISGTAAQSSSSQTTGVIAGQTITVGAGSITGSLDASSPVAALVVDNSTVATAAYKFVTANDSYTITEVGVDLSSATAASTVTLKDGATVLGSKPAATSLVFSGLSVPVAANSTKVLTVEVTLGTIGVGAGTSGSAITTTLDVSDTKALNSQGVSAAISGSDSAGNAMYAYAATPTITGVALASNSLLNTSARPLIRFKVDANGGTIGWSRLFFEVTKDSATVLAGATLWDVTGGANTQVTGTATHTTTGAASTAGTIEFDATAEQQISSSKTYELRGNVTLADASGDFITVNMSQEGAYAAPTTAAAVETADSDATIIWSDLSAQSHATTTSDWSGDYGVKNLPVSDSLNWPN